MPIIVKDFTWTQTESMVYITVPLKGVIRTKVDILSTENYVKLNFVPFFFECFLFGSVDDRLSAVEIGNGQAVFKLSKTEPGLWPQLGSPDAETKEAQRALRDAAVRRYGERSQEDKKQRDTSKHELGRFAVGEQMKLEQKERQRIEDVKESERKKATEELEKWKEHQIRLADEANENLSKRAEVQQQCQKKTIREWFAANNQNESNIFSDRSGKSCVRESGRIDVSFTPRSFPTPTRESTDLQEQEWLKKVAESQRIRDEQNKDLREEERNPQWLRDKGISYIKLGDYKSAISAFSHAIQLDCHMASLFSNRALCYLAQLDEHELSESTRLEYCTRCIDDCSKTLELLTPPVAQNLESRLKAHVRRGTAYCHLEFYVDALKDYEAALKLKPNDENLRVDAERMRKIVQGSEEI